MSESYSDVINKNIQKYGIWAKYAYHYTDITNSVSILSSGYLYSRKICIEKKIMLNDNASSSVIGNTDISTKNDVRFYFRPLTPTQYHNEGYKHEQIRFFSDKNANVPVPIFFLFNLEKMLRNLPNLRFSATGRAGYSNIEILSGIDEFKSLPFDKIYSKGFYNSDEIDLKPYRHAELAVNNEFDILPYLERIVCRNKIEYFTLVNFTRCANGNQKVKDLTVEKLR